MEECNFYQLTLDRLNNKKLFPINDGAKKLSQRVREQAVKENGDRYHRKIDARRLLLQFLVSEMFRFYSGKYFNNGNLKWGAEYPEHTRKTITNLLESHGQFTSIEIDPIFEQFRRNATKTNEHTLKYGFHYSPFRDHISTQKGTEKDKNTTIPSPFSYSMPFTDHNTITYLGLCSCKIETATCPDCGRRVQISGENMTSSTHSILCTCHFNHYDGYTAKGIIKEGRPLHHGSWNDPNTISMTRGSKFRRTDYFYLYHSPCNDSELEGQKGPMFIRGIWIDDLDDDHLDDKKIILELECKSRRHRNVIKQTSKEFNSVWSYPDKRWFPTRFELD